MKYENKGRKSKIFICSILVLSMILNMSGFSYAKRYDKENFPISQTRDDFPDSYKPYIDALKAKHPNWIFKAVYTGLDWNEVVTHESYEVSESISLVPDSYGPEWKKDGKNYYKDGNFVIASKEAVKYMLDPRNHLTEDEIFQFETLNYSSTAHTQEAIEKVLYGTSMYQRSEYKNAGNMINMGKTYSQIILEKAQKYNVSATHIASRIKQETGGDIIYNQSINGSYPGLEGLYNFFNIGASSNSNGQGAIENGLRYAKTMGWTTPEASIDGGVDALRNNWIKWGQNTTYFQKWDVNNEGNAIALYAYQYMQNILAPTSESIMTKRAYERAGLLNETYEFKIPVYENMPVHASPYPGSPEVPESDYEEDNTRIQVDSDIGLNVRTGPGTNYSIITALPNGTQMTRIAKSKSTQWDKVRLDNGMEGYVFRDGTKDIETYIKVESVSLDVAEKVIKIDETLKLNATVKPDNAKNKEVEWYSSDNNIATVDQNGLVTPKSLGEVTITVKTKDQGLTANCKLKIENYIEVTEVKLNINEKRMKKGEEFNLEATVEPQDAKYKDVEFSSSDENVATVDNTGKVTAKNGGEAVITVRTKDQGKTATCKITVDFNVEIITLPKNNYQVIKGESIEILPTVLPENATNKKYTVKIDDTNIAEYSDGKVIAKNSGTTKITFKTEDMEKEVSATINVIDIENNEVFIDNSLNYDSNTNYISKVEPGTKLSDIKDKFISKLNITIKDNNGNELKDDDVIGTGTKVIATDTDGNIIHEYSIIIYGDVDGNGAIDIIDLLSVKQHIENIYNLEGIFFTAANITRTDSEIDIIDLLSVKQHIEGIEYISQNG